MARGISKRGLADGRFTPQQTGQLDLEKLRDNLKALIGDSKSDCAGYVKSLLKQAEELTRNNPPEFQAPYPYNPPQFTNPLDRFDEFKFTMGRTGSLGGTTSGLLRDKTAIVHLVDLWHAPGGWESQPALVVEQTLAQIALHEMIHLAGTSSSLGYGDMELAIATSRLPDAPALTVDPKGKFAQGEYSKYWNEQLLLHCNFNKK